jgi:hypothetical protein
MLKKHPFDGVTNQELTQQLIGLQKAKSKFPSLFKTENVIYPPKVNLEQTSSEISAQYKASLIEGNEVIDLTGGYGIDAVAFCKAGKNTTHIELNPELQVYSQELFKTLDLAIISYCGDGIDYLKQQDKKYHTIYLDPSRKTKEKVKAILLEDYEPNVIQHEELLLSKSDQIIIKTSPLLDIKAGLSQLSHVAEIHVVAYKNEVKELLWIIKEKNQDTSIKCVHLHSNDPIVESKLITNQNARLQPVSKFLFEPNAAVMKSQQFDHISHFYKVDKIDVNSHFFTSVKNLNFPGRSFKVNGVTPYKPKEVKQKYAKSNYGVISRNFRESVAQLRKKYQLGEHDTKYLIFTQELGKSVVIEAEKLETPKL